jgi:hypothetical protein
MLPRCGRDDKNQLSTNVVLIDLLIFEAFAASISPTSLRAADQELIVSD